MKFPFLIGSLCAVLLIFISCNSESDKKSNRTNGFTEELKTREDSLFHDVMAGHDAGMARMGVIRKYLTRIQHGLDSMQKLPIEKLDVMYQQDLVELQEDLNQAEYGMNTWMDEFNADSGKGNTAVREKYLESERQKVQKVADAIVSSLRRADSIFNKK